MEEMKRNIEQRFQEIWQQITTEMDPATGLDEEPLLKKWWPTISHLEPDFSVLAQNLMGLNLNPMAAMLHVYAMGMAHILEGVANESILPLQSTETTPLPPWLAEVIYEALFEKYGDKH